MVTSRVAPAGTSSFTASEATGVSTFGSPSRASSAPSAEKSSQKSSSGTPQRGWTHDARRVTPAVAVVASAMVPKASCSGSTPAEVMKMPARPSPSRRALRFCFAPTYCRSPFQSFRVSDPSTPMKLGNVAQTAALTGIVEALRSSMVMEARGMLLASASVGTNGLKALRCTSRGTSGSVSTTRPNG